MWPFGRRQRDAEAIRRVFESYLDSTPEEIKAVFIHAGAGMDELKIERDVGDVVLVMVRDDDLSLIPSLLAKVIGCAKEQGFIMETMMSSLVLMAPLPFENNTPESRRLELVDHLHRSLPGEVKIAHGRKERLRGLLGAEGRFTYGSCLPRFGESLMALARANLGDVIEL